MSDASKPLRNARHEAFARKWASGATQTDAALTAGYGANTARKTGSELATKLDIQARKAWLASKMTEKVVTEFSKTRVEWLEKLWVISEKAETAEDYSAAVSGLRNVGLAQPKWYAPAEVEHSGHLTMTTFEEKVAAVRAKR